ncbi:hypothetical protein [Dactylosporangium sp. CA-139066]|uniref:hypothetical protein n=1 Tax=Dactylosporangium sp. CA-139066 TaxID=3239930 RepID=UPI003D8EF6A7
MSDDMSQDVTDYLAKTKPWQQDLCAMLRQTVLDTVPGVEEVIQYGRSGRPVRVGHGRCGDDLVNAAATNVRQQAGAGPRCRPRSWRRGRQRLGATCAAGQVRVAAARMHGWGALGAALSESSPVPSPRGSGP